MWVFAKMSSPITTDHDVLLSLLQGVPQESLSFLEMPTWAAPSFARNFTSGL